MATLAESTKAACPRQDMYVHIVSPEKDNKISPTMQKVMKVASIILICLGAVLILGGLTFLSAGIAVALGAAQAIITLGVGSLIGGVQMLNRAEKGEAPKATKFEVAGWTFDP